MHFRTAFALSLCLALAGCQSGVQPWGSLAQPKSEPTPAPSVDTPPPIGDAAAPGADDTDGSYRLVLPQLEGWSLVSGEQGHEGVSYQKFTYANAADDAYIQVYAGQVEGTPREQVAAIKAELTKRGIDTGVIKEGELLACFDVKVEKDAGRVCVRNYFTATFSLSVQFAGRWPAVDLQSPRAFDLFVGQTDLQSK